MIDNQIPWRCLVPADAVGILIGKEGANIRQMTETSGATLTFSQDGDLPATLADKIVVIGGSSEQQKQSACSQVLKKMRQMQGVIDGEPAVFVIVVPQTSCPVIIGAKGAQIKAIMQESDAEINVGREEIAGMSDQPISINGTSEQVVSAVSKLNAVLQNMFERGNLTERDFTFKGQNFDAAAEPARPRPEAKSGSANRGYTGSQGFSASRGIGDSLGRASGSIRHDDFDGGCDELAPQEAMREVAAVIAPPVAAPCTNAPASSVVIPAAAHTAAMQPSLADTGQSSSPGRRTQCGANDSRGPEQGSRESVGSCGGERPGCGGGCEHKTGGCGSSPGSQALSGGMHSPNGIANHGCTGSASLHGRPSYGQAAMGATGTGGISGMDGMGIDAMGMGGMGAMSGVGMGGMGMGGFGGTNGMGMVGSMMSAFGASSNEMAFLQMLQASGMNSAQLTLILIKDLVQNVLVPRGIMSEIAQRSGCRIDLGPEGPTGMLQVTLFGTMVSNSSAALLLQEKNVQWHQMHRQ